MAPMKKKVPAWVEKHFLCYCDFRPLRKWYYHSMTDKITLDWSWKKMRSFTFQIPPVRQSTHAYWSIREPHSNANQMPSALNARLNRCSWVSPLPCRKSQSPVNLSPHTHHNREKKIIENINKVFFLDIHFCLSYFFHLVLPELTCKFMVSCKENGAPLPCVNWMIMETLLLFIKRRKSLCGQLLSWILQGPLDEFFGVRLSSKQDQFHGRNVTP